MERYNEYKDSGVQWIGEIPSHWEMKRLKTILRVKDKRNLNPDALLLSVYTAIGVRPRHELEERGNKASTVINYKIVNKGDLIVNRLLAWMGAYGLSNYEGVTSPDYDVYSFHGDVNKEYYETFFRHTQFKSDCYKYGHGIMMMRWRTYSDEFLSINVPIPPKEEQDAIYNYLKPQVEKIDAAISQQQKMIDLLNERKQIIINNAVTKGLNPNVKMKNSGVDWIGEIPEGWSIAPIKHIIKFINGYAFNSNDFKSDGDVPVIRISNILDGQVCLDDIAYVSYKKELEPYVTHKGDLLIAMSGATTGKVGFDLEGGKYINQRVGAIRSEYQQFVFYWLNSTFFKEYVLLSALGSAQPNISSKGISNFQICLPMKEEIEEISCYIKRELNKIAPAVSNAKKQISLLQERKQIIINEVVTGKVKVC